MLATHANGYEHLRRNRLEVDAVMRHGITLTPEQLEAAPDGLLEWLVELGGGVVVDGEVVELPNGDQPQLGSGSNGSG